MQLSWNNCAVSLPASTPSLYNLPIPCYNELEMRYSPSNR